MLLSSTQEKKQVDRLLEIYSAIPVDINRQLACESILSIWWPDHTIKFIGNYQDYNEISIWLDATQGPKIIVQIEEDWFLKCDYQKVRQSIADHPSWNNESFVISNSRWDCEQMRALDIQQMCRPGILDLISYLEPISHQWCPDNIQDHCSLVFGPLSKYDHCRQKLIDTVMQQPDRVGIILAGKPLLVSREQLLIDCYINTDSYVIAPWVETSADSYLACSAFAPVIETQYRGVWCPTLSEKTYRCYHWQCPVIVNGGYCTSDYLKALGFDICDWMFDWSFDKLECPDQRQNAFLAEIQRLLAVPLPTLVELIQTNQSSLIHNQQNVRRLIYDYKTLDNLSW